MKAIDEAWVLLKARQSQMVYARGGGGGAIHPALYNEQKDRSSLYRDEDAISGHRKSRGLREPTPPTYTPTRRLNQHASFRQQISPGDPGDPTDYQRLEDDFAGDASMQTGFASRGIRRGPASVGHYPVRMPRPDAGQAMGFEQGFSPDLGMIRGKIANFQNQRALAQNAIPEQSVFPEQSAFPEQNVF